MQRRLAVARLIQHREPTLLLTGQAVSNLGDGVALVALTLLVLDTTHSASMLAWFAAARMAPTVAFLLVGGAVVDRFGRRTLLLISDGSRCVLTAALTVIIAVHALHYVELIVFALVFGIFDALFMPAYAALTPQIVPTELLPAMNSIRPLSSNLMGSMIGPALGGLLSAYSTAWAIAIDAATFAVSAGFLLAMRPVPAPERTQTTSMLHDVREGLAYVRQTTWFWTCLLAVALVNALVLVPEGVLVPYFLRHVLHAPKVEVGLIFTVGGVTGALMSLVAGNLPMPRRRIRTMFTVWGIGTAAGLVMGFATNFWEVALFPVIVSASIVLGNVFWESMVQEEVPAEMMGRASSVDWFVSLGLSPIGLVLAGALAAAIGVRTYYIVTTLVCLVPTVLILLSRRVNAVDAGRVRARAVGPAPGAAP
ncbi:MAG TPA: MFS transporter [Acidimicrobiales bacterium]|nr:MFS transporter [Acidimicrobiales bacterium]